MARLMIDRRAAEVVRARCCGRPGAARPTGAEWTGAVGATWPGETAVLKRSSPDQISASLACRWSITPRQSVRERERGQGRPLSINRSRALHASATLREASMASVSAFPEQLSVQEHSTQLR